MHEDIKTYNNLQSKNDKSICDVLAQQICRHLPEAENKVWYRHLVWFLESNPTVGYNKQKAGVRLMFWSGTDFEEGGLPGKGEKFKDASVFYNNVDEIDTEVPKALA